LSTGQSRGNRAWPRILPYVVLVLLIIGGCVAIMPKMGSHRRGPIGDAKVQMNALETALDVFKVDNGFYPSTAMGLQALVTQPQGARNWHQYLNAIPKDPWGHDYIYACPGKHRPKTYDLSSAGPDGKAGTQDDIVNWSIAK
jgi:general secretion pathway protein G